MDFLSRYLEKLEAQAEKNPDRADLAEELTRSKNLLARLEQQAAEEGLGR